MNFEMVKIIKATLNKVVKRRNTIKDRATAEFVQLANSNSDYEDWERFEQEIVNLIVEYKDLTAQIQALECVLENND